MDTARLLELGPVTEEPALNSFFQDRSRRAAQTAEALDLIRAQDGRIMMVTHQVNRSASISAVSTVEPRMNSINSRVLGS